MPADDDTFDRLRRRVLWSLPTGLFVVGSHAGEEWNLMTANWVMQVSMTPKLVAVSVEAGARTKALIEAGGGFSVSILDVEDRALIRRFVKPTEEIDVDRDGLPRAMAGQPTWVLAGQPVLQAAVGAVTCVLRPAEVPSESHRVFVGEVTEVWESERAADATILTMSDTRMNYGG